MEKLDSFAQPSVAQSLSQITRYNLIWTIKYKENKGQRKLSRTHTKGCPRIECRQSEPNKGTGDIAKFEEGQTPFKVYANHRGPLMGGTLVKEKIKIQVKDFTCKIKGNKKVKNESRDPGSGVFIFNGKLCTRDAVSHSQTSQFSGPQEPTC